MAEGDLLRVQHGGSETTGWLRVLVPVGDASRLFEIRVQIQGTDWTVGAPVRVAVPVAAARQALVVPRDALVIRSFGIHVFVVLEEGQVEMRPVEVRYGEQDWIAVDGSLRAGESVVIRAMNACLRARWCACWNREALRTGLSNPTAVAVSVLLVTLFGAVSLFGLPVQLIPEVELPEITITTEWRSASAAEVESELVKPQEDALRGLQGMVELVSEARPGRAELSLKFVAGTRLARALVEVLSRLNQVTDYPPDAGEPFISSSGSDANPIAWFILQPLPGNHLDVAAYRDYVEEVVKTRIERVPGVARSEVYGGAVASCA